MLVALACALRGSLAPEAEAGKCRGKDDCKTLCPWCAKRGELLRSDAEPDCRSGTGAGCEAGQEMMVPWLFSNQH